MTKYVIPFPFVNNLITNRITHSQVIDALLKEICGALLESDVNVKLVSQLRQKVKTKVKAQFEAGADRGKEQNRKLVVQRVRTLLRVVG